MSWLKKSRKAKEESNARDRELAARAALTEEREEQALRRLWAQKASEVSSYWDRWRSLEVDRILADILREGIFPATHLSCPKIVLSPTGRVYLRLEDRKWIAVHGDTARILGYDDSIPEAVYRLRGWSDLEALEFRYVTTELYRLIKRWFGGLIDGDYGHESYTVFRIDMTPTEIVCNGELLASLEQIRRPSDLETRLDDFISLGMTEHAKR